MTNAPDPARQQAEERLTAIAEANCLAILSMLQQHHGCACPACRTYVLKEMMCLIMNDIDIDDVEVAARHFVERGLWMRRQTRNAAKFVAACEAAGAGALPVGTA